MRHKMSGSLSVLAIGAIIAVATSQGQAASYSTFTGGDPGDGLDLQGTFPLALNLAKNATDPTPTVGDAVFERMYVDGGGVQSPPGVSSGGSTASSFQYNYNSEIGVGGPPNYGSTAADNGLEDVMNSTWQNGFVVSLTVGAPGSGARLIQGQPYKVQLFGLADNNDSLTRTTRFLIEQQDQGTFDFTNTGGFLTEGGVITAEFIANDISDGATTNPDGFITFVSVNGENTGNSGFMGGLTVELVPEPASLSLLGGLALLMRRRSRG